MSTYTAPDLTKPAGSQTGSVFATSANANDAALAYASISGGLLGWTYAASGGTAEEPTTQTWTNGVYRVKHTITWGTTGAEDGNIKTLVVQVSQDSGTTYATAFTITNTIDASGNITASSGGGGLINWLSYLLGKVKTLLTNFNTHTAATGTAVHGLGTMSTQNATAVNIDGGSIDNTPIGATTWSSVRAIYYRARVVGLGTITTATAIDWTLGDYFVVTIGTGGSLTFTNLPPASEVQGITVEVTNPASPSNPFPATVKWPGGSVPTFTASGVDLFEFTCRDGTTVRGVEAEKDTR